MSTAEATPAADAAVIEAAKPVKLTVALPEEAVREIDEIARARSKTKTQVLREAIALKAFIEREMSVPGTRLLIQQPSGEMREIVFTS